MVYFDFPLSVAVLLLLASLYYFWKKLHFKDTVQLFYPSLSFFHASQPTFKSRLAPWINVAIASGLSVLCVAFLDPHIRLFSEKKQPFSPQEGIGVYLVFDQSGSMREQVSFLLEEGQTSRMTKMELLKRRAKEFINKRPYDLIGLVSFARIPIVLSPLTINHEIILDRLNSLQVVTDKTKDGTAIGYALYKTANLIVSTKEYYRQEGEDLQAIIILVSDGLQDPNPLDRGHAYRAMELEDAANFAKNNNIKIYIINIEPRLKEKRFEPNLRQLKRIAQMTGGQFFLADGSQGIEAIFKELNELEKTKISTKGKEQAYEKFSFYPYGVALGLAILFAAYFLQNTFLRQIP